LRWTSRDRRRHFRGQRIAGQKTCSQFGNKEGLGAVFARNIIDRFPSRPKQPQISDWITAVENYCSRNLTNEQDKLPAIAGIARYYQLLTNSQHGRYLTGLWEHSPLFLLLWHTTPHWKFHFNPSNRKPRSYRAPSWSWASIDGRVYFWYEPRKSEKFTYTATIVRCTTESQPRIHLARYLRGI